MIKLLVLVLMVFLSGCSVICKDGTFAASFFAGAVSGYIDPETGTGNWIRVGDYDASGVEILKEGDDYLIQFDKSKSRTEFDKMKFFLETGIKIGAAGL